jgi:cytochrome c-type biogenesis protein
VVLLAAYSLGLGPFLALALSLQRVRGWLRGLGRSVGVLQSVSGLLLVAMGVLLVTDRWLPLVAPVLAWYAQARWPHL